MPRRSLRVAVSTFGIAIIAFGCIKSANSGADGSSCSSDDDCKSKRCTEGECAGRACSGGDAGASECDPGWVCFVPSVSDNPLEQFFGSDDEGPTCAPTCGACPAKEHCPIIGGAPVASSSESDAGIYCASGPPRVATIDGPDTVQAGSTATYTVHFSPDMSFDVYEWSEGPTGETPQGIFGGPGTQGPTLTASFSGSPVGDGEARLYVSASDVNTPKDPELQTAEGVRTIHVTCSPKGGDCSAFGSCCASGSSCQFTGATGTCM